MRRSLSAAAAALLALSLPVTTALAQGAIESRRITFRPGSAAAQVRGTLKGDQTIDYRLRAGAGQRLTVDLEASHPQTTFNVIAAGSSSARFIGSVAGHRFSGLLPSDGDVTVRVSLMRPAARHHETGTYALRLGIAGPALAPLPASRDALVPGTPYHATAEVPCWTESPGKAARCPAGVIRRADSGATVVVTDPGGQKRQFLFVQGRAVASDQPESLSVQRRGDRSILTLGSGLERCEIPEALVLGG